MSQSLLAVGRRNPYLMLGVLGALMVLAFVQLDVLARTVPVGVLFIWQVCTGMLVTALVFYQMLLLVFRVCGIKTQAHYKAHRWVGASSITVFAFHAVGFGYAWTNMLAVCFALSAITGLLNREVINYKHKWIYIFWYWCHVTISINLIPLIIIHIWVALSFEGI